MLDKIIKLFTPKKKKKKKNQTVKATPVNHEAVKKKINTRNVVLNRSSNQNNNTSRKKVVTRKKQTSDLKNNNMKTTSKKIAPIKDNNSINIEKARKNWQEEKKSKEVKSQELKKILENKGVTTNKGKSLYSTPNAFAEREKLLTNNSKYKIMPKKDITKLNENNINKSEISNLKKYHEVTKTNEVKNKTKELESQRVKSALAKREYINTKAKNKPVTLYEKTVGNLTRGVSNLLLPEDEMYKNENGEWVPIEAYSSVRQQAVVDNMDTNVGKFLGNAGYNLAKQITAAGLNTITGGVGGSVAYGYNMFDENYNDALRENKDEGKALLNASIITLSEMTLGKLMGGMPQVYGKGKLPNIIAKNVGKKVLKNDNVKKMASNMTSEAMEEFVQEYITNITNDTVLNDKKFIDSVKENVTSKEVLENALYSAVMGAFNSGIMNAPSTISNVRNERQMRSTYNENESRISNLKNDASILQEQLRNAQNVVQAQPIQEQIENAINEIRGLREQNNQIRQVIDVDTPTLSNNDILKVNNIDNSIYSNLNTQQKTNDFRENTNMNLKNNEQLKNSYKSSKFDSDMKKFESGNYTTNDTITVLDTTPEYFYNLGYKIDAPLVINMTKLQAIMKNKQTVQEGLNQHGITRDVIEQLPYAISNPLNVIKNPNYRNRYVIVTELSDKYGDIIVVPVEIDMNGKHNRIVSIYGKEQYDGNTNPDIKGYMEQNKENVVYDIDDDIQKKSRPLDAPIALRGNSSNDTISQSNDNVKSDNVSIKYSMQENQNNTVNFQNNQTWQEHLEENYKSSGTKTNLKENMKKNVPKTTKVLPIKSVNTQELENSSFSMQKNKKENPITISKLTKEDANTTPKLDNKKGIKKGKDSQFFNSLTSKTNFLSDDVKNMMKTEEGLKYYSGITNEETLNEAYNKLNKNGVQETNAWFRKNASESTPTDIAEGFILLKQYQDNGDYDSAINVAKQLKEFGTKAGQTVQAFSILERMTPEGMVMYAQSELTDAYNRMVEGKSKEWIEKNAQDFQLTTSEVAEITKLMKELPKLKDQYERDVNLGKIQRIIVDKLPPERGQGIKAWMRTSMLLNLRTQVRNVVGNSVIVPVNVVGDRFASIVDRQLAKRTGVRTKGTTKAKNIAKGVKTGIYRSYNDFKNKINTRDFQGDRWEIGHGNAFNNKTLIGRKMNSIDRFNSFLLDVGDRPFYEATFINSLNNQLELNNTKTPTPEMIDIATTEALQRTWQDNNNYTKLVLRIRKAANIINFKGYGLGDWLIPFAKTPANITKALVDYSPIGLSKTLISDVRKFNNSLENGQYTPALQHKLADNLGKGLAGSLLYIVGYALAQADIISGAGDDDKDVANFMKNSLGIQPYSIKIGNKSFTYDWAQPIATPLMVMADYKRLSQENSDMNAIDKLFSTFDLASQQLMEQSFLQSINEFLNGTGNAGERFMQTVAELPSRAIPTFVKQIADMIDPTVRSPYEKNKIFKTALNKMMVKIPGLKSKVAPSTDTFGNEIKKDNNLFDVFINPANVTQAKLTNAGKEIYKLYKETGDKNVFPKVVPYSIMYKGENINISAKDKAKMQKIEGKIIEDNVNKLVSSPKYKSLSSDKKVEVITNITNLGFNTARKEVLNLEMPSKYDNPMEFIAKGGTASEYYTFLQYVDDDPDKRKKSITEYLVSSDLNDELIADLYNNYYYRYTKTSKYDTMQNILNSGIDMKEFLKFSLVSDNIKSDKDENGKTIRNSKKRKWIAEVNKLNLSIPQKAILIKKQYSSYTDYDSEIIKYVNNLDITKKEKEDILLQLGFEKDTLGNITSKSTGSKSGRKRSSKKKKSASVTRTKVAPVKLNSKVVDSAKSVSTNKSQYNDVLENLINYQNLSDEEKRKMLVKVGNKK